MKLTKKQKLAVLPHLQRAVQAQIDCWEAQRDIENELDKEIDEMGQGLEDLAIGADSGTDVTIDEIQDYIDSCRVVK